ncbi:MAG: glycosyltransferase family 39 protein [Lachnospiraceae bacterium]|nr:glycosyltransferase family 39 protein [Lachnospiraceae bacterium]
MKYNKTTFNYIIWGLLCILTFAGIGVCAIGVSESMQNEAYLLFVGAFYAIFLVVCTVLIVGFRALKNALDGKVDFSKYRVGGILETVLVFAVIIAAMIIRFSLTVGRLTDGAGVTVINGSRAYFDYAVGNIDAIGTGTNGAYLYAGILRGVLSLFGENIIMIYVLQAVFTLGIMLCTFYALKFSMGKLPAWISLFLIAFLPGSIQLFMYCTPGLMYTFLVSVYFLGVVMLFRALEDGRISDNKHLAFFAAAGLYAGFLCYFDPSALVLLPLTVLSFFCFKVPAPGSTAEKPMIQSGIFAGSAVLFLLVSLFAFPAGISGGVTGVARYFTQFVPREGINFTILTPHYGVWDSVLLYCFTGLWLLAFLKCKKDRGLIFAVTAVVLILFQFFTFDHVDYNPVISFCFVMLGTLGLLSLPVLILPAGVESKEEYNEKLAEIEKKRHEKENHKFSQKIERENKRAAHSKSKTIVLGKDVHMTMEGEEIASAETKTETPESVNEKETAAAVATAVAEPAAEEKAGRSILDIEEIETKTETAADVSKEAEKDISEAAQASAETEGSVQSDNAVQNETSAQDVTPAESDAPVQNVASVENEVAAQSVTPAENGTISETEVVAETETKEISPDTAKMPVPDENATENVSEETGSEPQPAPVKRELPPYVPQKMVRRRGKMFSPVKKAETPSYENNENVEGISTPLDDLKLKNIALSTGQETNEAAETAETAVTAETAATAEAITVQTEAVPEVTETVPAAEEVSPASEESIRTETEESPAESITTAEEKTTEEKTPEEKTPEETTAPSEETKEAAKTETVQTAEESKEKSSETASAPAQFNNPVPGPKPHVPRELAYDYDPKEEEMDFDITDLDGKDFYDV